MLPAEKADEEWESEDVDEEADEGGANKRRRTMKMSATSHNIAAVIYTCTQVRDSSPWAFLTVPSSWTLVRRLIQ